MGLKILGKMGIIAIKQDVMRIKLHEDTVICRVGSLEIILKLLLSHRRVICRVGSLETFRNKGKMEATCYLPCRQFRNERTASC